MANETEKTNQVADLKQQFSDGLEKFFCDLGLNVETKTVGKKEYVKLVGGKCVHATHIQTLLNIPVAGQAYYQPVGPGMEIRYKVQEESVFSTIRHVVLAQVLANTHASDVTNIILANANLGVGAVPIEPVNREGGVSVTPVINWFLI